MCHWHLRALLSQSLNSEPRRGHVDSRRSDRSAHALEGAVYFTRPAMSTEGGVNGISCSYRSSFFLPDGWPHLY